jgi:hypothetical protein
LDVVLAQNIFELALVASQSSRVESTKLKSLHCFISTVGLIILSLASFAPPASATVFQASGVFEDGAILGGTIAIDTSAGLVSESNLTISGAGTFSTIIFQSNFGPPAFYSVIVDNSTLSEEFSFGLVTDTLVGFTGGNFCSDSTADCLASVYYSTSDSLNQISLSNGEVRAVAPEPAMLSFWGTLFVACIVLFQYHRKCSPAAAGFRC